MRLLRLGCLRLGIGVLAAPPAQGQQQRPMVVDDLFSLEQLGPVTASPDGEWLAVVITRPRSSAETYRNFSDVWYHSDIWLVRRRTGERHNITRGLDDGSGYWNPLWSPDGRRLALLSTRGGDNVRPYIYDIATDSLRRGTERGADIQAFRERGFQGYGMLWSDSTTLLCSVLPEGAPAWYAMSKAKSFDIAIAAWGDAQRGVVPTASVLESGREVPESERPMGALLEIDVRSGQSRVVAKGNVRLLLISPTNRHLALIAETGRIPPRTGRKIPYGNRAWALQRTRLAIVPLKRRARPVWVDDVHDPVNASLTAPHTWAPDGATFAVIGKATKDTEFATTLSLVSASTGAARAVAWREVEVSATAWSGGGGLLALARPRVHPVMEDDTTRYDWWVVDVGRAMVVRSLTAGSNVVPQTLLRSPSRNTVLGIASGELWSININDATVSSVTKDFDPELVSIIWPAHAASRARPGHEIIARTTGNDYYRVPSNGVSAPIRLLARPSKTATIAEYRPDTKLVVYTDDASDGTFLWMGDGSADGFERTIALNEHLGRIADPKRVLIEYRGIDGDSLKGVILLPVRYEAGKRYPLVAYVYPGTIVSDTENPAFSKHPTGLSGSLNMNLLAGAGYAVLVPSIPVRLRGDGTDPWIDLPKGIMPALDKAIDVGIADPERLGVMGLSYGGYATYSLVTYSYRFKAAVALAGNANLVSWYGQFNPASRYADDVHEDLLAALLNESSPMGMGNTPWADLWRYLRNSPIYFADRVETPIMMIHGDIDPAPIEQAEEFFRALYRQGKRAKFVRYWGEAHWIESPANIRDMWQRILGWFDEHLKGGKPTAPPKVRPSPAR